jgi:hypothetical protein
MPVSLHLAAARLLPRRPFPHSPRHSLLQTVRFGGVDSLGSQRSGGKAAGPMPAAAALAAAKATSASPDQQQQAQAAGSGPLQAPAGPGAGGKGVRFAIESPVDHFTGLSNTSSMLSSVDEERAA